MASNSEKMKARQTLSASISAEALLNHQEHVSRRPVQFTITDILPQKNGIKVDASLPTSPSTLGPLSLPRPGKNATFFLTSGTEQSPPVAPKSIKKESDPEAQQRELERVQRDPEILRAIDSVRVLSAQFKDVAQNTMGHRKDLGLTLFRIEESYLKLFEKLLELSLRLYWDYEQRTEAQRREDRATAERWREKYERKSVECVKINKKLAAREIIHRTREIELRDYQGQTKEIEKELGSQRELEAQILQLQDAAALQRVLGRKLQDDYALLTLREEVLQLHFDGGDGLHECGTD
uniref:Uncharacterized protein n=1 Tax=Phytophthora ramorum TaxID=164328 RepID=H3GLF3_PHYRM